MAGNYAHYVHLDVDNLTLSGPTYITGMISGFVRSDVSGKLYCSGGLTNSDLNSVNKIAGSVSSSANLVIGNTTMNISGGSSNVVIGGGAGGSLSGGNNNCFIGSNAGNANITSSTNIGIGYYALARSTAAGNFAFGYNAGGGILTGADNMAIGHFSLAPYLSGVLTGSYNICIGRYTGTAYQSSEANNILIGPNLSGFAGESGVCRIGLSGTHNATYIDNKIFELTPLNSISGTLTLSGTWLKGMLINTSSGQTWTLPTGAQIQALYPYTQAGMAFDVKLSNIGGNLNLSGGSNSFLFGPPAPLTTSVILKFYNTASGVWSCYV
jgi:hypothetical protein